MSVPLRHGHGALIDGKSVDVERRSKIDGGTHGTEPMDAQQVVANPDRRRLLAVELPGNCAMLQV